LPHCGGGAPYSILFGALLWWLQVQEVFGREWEVKGRWMGKSPLGAKSMQSFLAWLDKS